MAIKISTGPMPAMSAGKTSERTELQKAILEMPPGSWFIVPGTAGKTSRQCAGLRSGISRFCRRLNIVGVATGFAADGSGLVVRKTGELEVVRSNVSTPANPGPAISGRPKASRL